METRTFLGYAVMVSIIMLPWSDLVIRSFSWRIPNMNMLRNFTRKISQIFNPKVKLPKRPKPWYSPLTRDERYDVAEAFQGFFHRADGWHFKRSDRANKWMVYLKEPKLLSGYSPISMLDMVIHRSTPEVLSRTLLESAYSKLEPSYRPDATRLDYAEYIALHRTYDPPATPTFDISKETEWRQDLSELRDLEKHNKKFLTRFVEVPYFVVYDRAVLLSRKVKDHPRRAAAVGAAGIALAVLAILVFASPTGKDLPLPPKPSPSTAAIGPTPSPAVSQTSSPSASSAPSVSTAPSTEPSSPPASESASASPTGSATPSPSPSGSFHVIVVPIVPPSPGSSTPPPGGGSTTGKPAAVKLIPTGNGASKVAHKADFFYGFWAKYDGLYHYNCYAVGGSHPEALVNSGIIVRNYPRAITVPSVVDRTCANAPKRTTLHILAADRKVSFGRGSYVYGTITIGGRPANADRNGINQPCVISLSNSRTPGPSRSSGTVTYGQINWIPGTRIPRLPPCKLR